LPDTHPAQYLASFMRVLLVGDDPNDQNLHQKGAPFYNVLHTVFGFELVAADSKDIGAG